MTSLAKLPHSTVPLSRASEYKCWQAMKNRCSNPRSPDYKRYGGRGITVCERWMSFANFLADMGSRPDQSYTIERIDNNGSYEPGNCSWLPKSKQAKNTRTVRMLTHEGETMCVSDWARRLGICAATLSARIDRGQDLAQALSGELQSKGRRTIGATKQTSVLTIRMSQDEHDRIVSDAISLGLSVNRHCVNRLLGADTNLRIEQRKAAGA